MNKIYSLFAILIFSTSVLFAGVGCTIDTTNTSFFSPGPDSIPCVERGNAYNQIIQIHVPDKFDVAPFVGFGFPILLNVDSMRIDSITGFPTNMNYSLNPFGGFFRGGDNGCAFVYGNTSDPAGNYPLTIHGTISVSGIPQGFGFPSDTTFDLATAQSFSTMFSLSVDVINPGDSCRPQLNSAIKNFSNQLNSLMHVSPNPSNGVFTFKLDAGRRINGEIAVMDMTGRRIFTQPIDVVGLYNTTINLTNYSKGLYTLQLRTAEGFASKSISIE